MEPSRSDPAVSKKIAIPRKPVPGRNRGEYTPVSPTGEPGSDISAQGDYRPASAICDVPSKESCVASFLLFAAIITVLAWCNNKPLPDWPGSLTVNTVIALLATVCRAATVVPISEGISQMKWNWLASAKRPLKDLEILDQASRGPWGSLRMVVTVQGHIYAVAAALVLVTGLATSTFTQSAISYTTHLATVPYQTADARMLETAPPLSLEEEDRDGFYNNVRRAAYQAILGTSNSSLSPQPTEPFCTSGECRYLGRFLVTNISSPASKPQERTIAFTDEPHLLNATFSQFFIIYHYAGCFETRDCLFAIEMLWHFCVHTYSMSVENGRSHINTRSHTEVAGRTLDGGVILQTPDSSMNFTAQDIMFDLGRDFRRSLSGSSFSVQGESAVLYTEIMYKLQNDIKLTADPEHRRGVIQENTQRLGEAVATAMTNELRLSGEVRHVEAQVETILITVRWPWLAFLAAQIVLTVAFLAAVIIQASQLGVEVVKSSQAATLGDPGASATS
ncbi:hypothetical protein B0I35DRAFT_512942 [Stachybotrys elegans]|uniref:Uncharacterized protein n=1 Tax=Stachybotrys elegans TaxID=80388 RepID=A0A8K0SQY0_9HYPO|nr:hypothetical protein B0I35DRAFT_512942 [Stachybotrys elegans]